QLARPRMTTAEFFWRAVIFISVALVPVLIWFLFDVILIVVGAILIAVLLRLVAEPFMRWGKLPQTVALILSGFHHRRGCRRGLRVRQSNRSRVYGCHAAHQ